MGLAGGSVEGSFEGSVEGSVEVLKSLNHVITESGDVAPCDGLHDDGPSAEVTVLQRRVPWGLRS